MTWRPSADLYVLEARAKLTARARSFFADRAVLEIDPPCLQRGANLDRGVEPFAVACSDDEQRYLATSPEHSLKRIVAAYRRDCYALCPAFRRGEIGSRHGPEFRMLEWYRVGWPLEDLCAETIALVNLLSARDDAVRTTTYRQAFVQHAGIDPFAVANRDGSGWDVAGLRRHVGREADAIPDEDLLDYLLVTRVEPQLGRDGWEWLIDYPADQAAQARHCSDEHGHLVARRAELYRDGVELANGYDECTDPDELRQRLTHEAGRRTPAPAIDEAYLAAVPQLPDCSGIALGFDRLIAWCLDVSLSAVQSFDWRHC